MTGPGSATAGSAFDVTVTAKDASNTTITSYTGSVHFTSPDSQAVLPTDYPFLAGDNGSHTFSVTLKTAGSSQTVTVLDQPAGKSGTSGNINVSPGPLASITIAPANATITAGGSQSYTATAADQYGNSRGDVTGGTAFSLSPDGSCTGATCTAMVAGPHAVTGTNGSVTATASLQVNAGALDHITISPASATISAGGAQLYTAEGFDQYGNSRGDVTASTTFSISPDGSCTGATCTATVAGPHTVTGTNGSVTGTASLQVNAALQVAITQPSLGATVSAGMLLVRGTIQAGGEVGVSVNGVPAAIEGSIFAALVPVALDTTTVTATATTATGATASSSVAITVSSTSGDAIELGATPFSGVAPLTVSFSLGGGPAPVTIELDFDGDGTVDFTGPSLNGQTFTYSGPGLYFPVATVTGIGGAQLTARGIVQVYNVAALDASLQGKWRAMKDALRAVDTTKALTHIVTRSRPRYDAIFLALGQDLTGIDTILMDITLREVRGAEVIYEMLRTDNSVVKSFEIRFLSDVDGLWRLWMF